MGANSIFCKLFIPQSKGPLVSFPSRTRERRIQCVVRGTYSFRSGCCSASTCVGGLGEPLSHSDINVYITEWRASTTNPEKPASSTADRCLFCKLGRPEGAVAGGK